MGTDAGHLSGGWCRFYRGAPSEFCAGTLVSHIPDELVKWGVVDVVQCDGQFHRAQTGGEMPAGTAHAVEQIAAQFVAKLGQALFGSSLNSRVESTSAVVGYLAISKLIASSLDM